MIGNELNQALEFLYAAQNEFLDAANILVESGPRSGCEIEEAIELADLKDEVDKLVEAAKSLLSKFSYSVSTPTKNPVDYFSEIFTQKQFLIEKQDSLRKDFILMFGKDWISLDIQFVVRLLDVVYYEGSVFPFNRVDKSSKSLILGLIAFWYKRKYYCQIELVNGKLCAVNFHFHFRIYFEKYLTGRENKELWLYNCDNHLLNFAKDNKLIPKEFQGIDFF